MAHLMKHTKASCGHMFAHYVRKAEHISKRINYSKRPSDVSFRSRTTF